MASDKVNSNRIILQIKALLNILSYEIDAFFFERTSIEYYASEIEQRAHITITATYVTAFTHMYHRHNVA